MANELFKLQEWFISNCETHLPMADTDGNIIEEVAGGVGRYLDATKIDIDKQLWQHDYRIRIHTIDRPGWAVALPLTETALEEASLSLHEVTNGPDDWLKCEIKDQQFIGQGDPLKLTVILDRFFQLTPEITPSGENSIMPNGFTKLQEWYAAQCVKIKEKAPEAAMPWISIDTDYHPSWSMGADLAGTDLDGATMPWINIDNDGKFWQEQDWLTCNVQQNSFNGIGDHLKLGVILDYFFKLTPTLQQKDR